jgi:hypothetical protein
MQPFSRLREKVPKADEGASEASCLCLVLEGQDQQHASLRSRPSSAPSGHLLPRAGEGLDSCALPRTGERLDSREFPQAVVEDLDSREPPQARERPGSRNGRGSARFRVRPNDATRGGRTMRPQRPAAGSQQRSWSSAPRVPRYETPRAGEGDHSGGAQGLEGSLARPPGPVASRSGLRARQSGLRAKQKAPRLDGGSLRAGQTGLSLDEIRAGRKPTGLARKAFRLAIGARIVAIGVREGLRARQIGWSARQFTLRAKPDCLRATHFRWRLALFGRHLASRSVRARHRGLRSKGFAGRNRLGR